MDDRLPWERPLGAVPVPDGTHDLPGLGAAGPRGERRARGPVGRPDRRRRRLRGDASTPCPATTTATAWTAPTALPDPCSRCQPDGVRGPSRVVDPAAFAWDDGGWRGSTARDLVIYELHVGTFTPEGTFDAAVAAAARAARARRDRHRADAGRDRSPAGATGATTASTPWAPQNGLRRARGPAPAWSTPRTRAGLARGPRRRLQPPRARGQRALEAFGPYFTDRYAHAVGRGHELRRPRRATRCAAASIENALHVARASTTSTGCGWTPSTRSTTGARATCLAELCERAARDRAGRPPLLIAESDLNDPQRHPRRASSAAGASTPSGPTTSTTRSTRCSPASATATTPTSARVRAPGRARTATAFVYTRQHSRVPAPAPRRARRRPAAAPVRRLRAEPRPGRQPRRWATGCRLRGPSGSWRRCWMLLSPFVADAVHGRGVRRDARRSSSSPTTSTRSSPTPSARGGGGSSPHSWASARRSRTRRTRRPSKGRCLIDQPRTRGCATSTGACWRCGRRSPRRRPASGGIPSAGTS